MNTVAYTRNVRIPTVAEFLQKYPHYAAVNTSERFLFDLIMTAANFVRAETVTSLGLPGVAAVANEVRKACDVRGGLTGFRKQMAGAIVCTLMEANQYEKTGTKRSVPCRDWSKGELYQQRPASSGTSAGGKRQQAAGVQVHDTSFGQEPGTIDLNG